MARATAIRVDLPGRVAAVEGRVLVDAGAAELIGLAPVGGGTVLTPIEVPGGYAFAGYDLRATEGSTSLRLVIAPHATGRVELRVMIDAAADAKGHPLTLGDAEFVVSLQVGTDGPRIAAPRGAERPRPPRAAGPTRSVFGRAIVSAEDLAAFRAAWYQARESGEACPTPSEIGGDANGDGCVDIADAQALLAAQGRRLPSGSEPSVAERRGSADARSTAGILAPGAAPTAVDAAPRTYVVTSTADTPDASPGNGSCADSQGRCTLRAAIIESNWNSGTDRIEFNLPGSAPVRIQLGTTLPNVGSGSGGVVIDGYTQPGSRANTAQFGTNAVPGVEVRGTGTNMGWAFYVPQGGSTFRGLLITDVSRGIFIDGANARNNRVVGNFMGFRPDNSLPARGKAGVVLNNGAKDNVIGSPALADRNVIGNFEKGIYSYGAGTDGNVSQNNVLCIRPNGLTAICQIGMDHDFGPKHSLVGGSGPNERNVIGPTNLNGLEFSHGWNPADRQSTTTWQINGHRIIGNWIGFRHDGNYSASYRSAQNVPTHDNGQGVNVYDGANDNVVEGNHIAAVYDGASSTMSNASRNVFRDNVIGESPHGQAAPLARWGIYFRLNTRDHVVEGNVIRNAGQGGIGLLEGSVREIRISRNIVTDTSGPAIFLANGANASVPPPSLGLATLSGASGIAVPGARVEVFRASRAVGQQGLPTQFLGATTVAGNGSWSLSFFSLIGSGDRVTALQIRPDQNTSALASNVLADGPVLPPSAPDADFAWQQQAGSLAVSFTDTSSGNPTTWSWDFGDGGSSSQANPTRTYAAPGVYTVVLTASNAGGSDQQTRTVTVEEVSVPPSGTLASDTFSRTVTNGWGSADLGGSYSLEGSSSSFAVNGGSGIMVLPATGANRATFLGGTSQRDVEVLFRVSADKAASGAAHYLYAVVRRNGNNAYRPKIIIFPNGNVSVHAGVVVNNGESSVAPSVTVPGLTHVPGEYIWVRAQVTGASPTTIRVKAWADGQPEPSGWQFVATNSTSAVQTAGAVGLRAYTSSSGAPFTFRFDDFSAAALP